MISFLVGLLLAAIGAKIFFEKKEKGDDYYERYLLDLQKIIGGGMIVIGGILMWVDLFTLIEAGHVGVQYSLVGGIQEFEFQEGLNIKPPWIYVTPYSFRVLQATEEMHTLSNEGLSVSLEATILWRIDPSKANEIHRHLGPYYKDVFIVPQFRSVVREIIAEHEAIDVYTEERALLERKVLEEVAKRLKKHNILVEGVLFRNVQLPQQLIKAIEEKKRAEQEALRMYYVLHRELLEAERKRVEAQGIADANLIIGDSLTDRYLRWYWISSLKDHTSVLYVPIGADGFPYFYFPEEDRDNVTRGNITRITRETGIRYVYDLSHWVYRPTNATFPMPTNITEEIFKSWVNLSR